MVAGFSALVTKAEVREPVAPCEKAALILNTVQGGHFDTPTIRRPRRLLRLHQSLTITREPTPTGWLLRFTGPQARSGLVDDVMDKVEEWFGRG
jgi:hypothetical protein